MLHLRGRQSSVYVPLSGVEGVVHLRILGVVMLTAMIVSFGGATMLGWAYEGPRRFFHRVGNRKPDWADGRI